MEVIAHQTVGKDMKSMGFLSVAKNLKKQAAIDIIAKNVAAFDATGHRMIDRAGIMYSWGSRHPMLTYCPLKSFPKKLILCLAPLLISCGPTKEKEPNYSYQQATPLKPGATGVG